MYYTNVVVVAWLHLLYFYWVNKKEMPLVASSTFLPTDSHSRE
jgi:hypothetical protein